jgi:methionyl-tRNA formyltransferase
MHEYHPLIATGRAPRIQQDLAQGSYFGRRRAEDGRVDWRWPARRIFNLIRAVTHPYPGAFCYAAGGKIFIWEARIANEDGWRGLPGEIIGETPDGLEIAAGPGSIIVKRAQFEAAGETDARAVLPETHRPRALL